MNIIAKIGLSLVSMILALIPIGIYFLARFIFSPEGFWQELILFGVGIWALGTLQVLFIAGWICILCSIWGD